MKIILTVLHFFIKFFQCFNTLFAFRFYCIRNGYGGVMIWHYNCDLPSTHDDSLLRAIGETVDKNYE